MRLVCTQENLSRVVSYLERIVGKQTTLPILSNILLEAEGGRLKLSATNLEIGVIVHIGAKIEEEGKITVPAKLLGNFIHNLPSGDVLEISEEASTLMIKSERYQGKIKGMDGKDFPIIPSFKGGEYPFSFPAQEFKGALNRVLFCVSQNESRMELTGVNVQAEEGGLALAATDSFRLAEQLLPTKKATFLAEQSSFIIPSSTCQELLRVIGQESKEVWVALEENQIFFEVDGVQVVSRLIHGKYPDYKQIIPNQFGMKVQLIKDDLLRAVKITGVLSSYNMGEITVKIIPEENKCLVRAISQEVGENEASLEIEKRESGSGEIEFTFNPRYILEGLNVLGGDKITFAANTSTSPVVLREVQEGKENNEYLYIVMPIRK